MHVGLVSCAARKQTVPAPARLLYASSLFRKAAAYAADHYDRWFVLSAKHGLLRPNEMIEPYDMTLGAMTMSMREVWARGVYERLQEMRIEKEVFYFHAGMEYRRLLQKMIRSESPLAGLRIGQQLAWYLARGY